MSMPDSERLRFVVQPHLSYAAAEQRLEHFAEVSVDDFERLGKTLARLDVDFVNRLLRIAD